MRKGIFTGAAVVFAALLFFSALSISAKSKKEKAKAITAITRESGSGTRAAFTELFDVTRLAANGKKIDAISASCDVTNSTAVCITQVAQNKNAIGYISLGSLSDKVKVLSIDGVTPSVENIKNGSYKIKRPFNIVTKGDVSAAANEFINYIMSESGKKIIESNGYIAVGGGVPYTKTAASGKVVINGSSSVHPIMEKLVEGFKGENSAVTIELSLSDSTIGIQSTQQGLCDIGMASRTLKDSESDLKALTIALDGIAIIVNPANSISDITRDRVRQIYTGEVSKW